MAVAIRCPNPDCREAYEFDDGKRGSGISCKACGTQFTVEIQGHDTVTPKASNSLKVTRRIRNTRPTHGPYEPCSTPAAAAPKRFPV